MSYDWQPTGPPPPQPPYQPPQPPQNKGKRFGIIAVLLIAIAGLAVGGGLVLVNRNSDGTADEATYVIMDQPAVSVQPVFEPAGDRGQDPFFPLETQLVSFQEDAMEEAIVAAGGMDDDGSSPIDPADFQVEALSEQAKTGLYGGTAENTCDPEKLIAFLIANPDLGQAWATVQGITFAELPSYIRSLEIRVLAEPVNVLNHGYNSSTKQPYQIDSVLDAGTAVLVDANGDIRTRCYCGNPILPKPPSDHKPPACLVYPWAVYLAPDSDVRRLNAPGTVYETGRVATYQGRPWSEVMWGDQPNQMGWTAYGNLQRRVYCRPITPPPLCPTAFLASVYPSPDSTELLGVLGLILKAPKLGISGQPLNGRVYPVSAADGGEQVIVNGRLLIHFSHPQLTTMSGWIDVADVNFNSTPAECEPFRACVSLPTAPMKPGGGGPIPGVGPGKHRIEISGRLTVEATATEITALPAEIKLLDQGNQLAWVDLFVENGVEGLPDSECDTPVTLCKREADDPLRNILWASPEATLALPGEGLTEAEIEALTDAENEGIIMTFLTQDFTVVRGFAGAVGVTLIGSTTPTNGRVEVQVGQGGPTGWIDASLLDGDLCIPTEICVTITTQIYSNYKDAGSVLPGTPNASPQNVRFYQAGAVEFPPGTTNPLEALGPENIYIHVEVNGVRGWAPLSALLAGFEGGEGPSCLPPPPPPPCPDTSFVAVQDVAVNETCCVSLPQGAQPVAFTGRSRPAAAGGTEYEVRAADSSYAWVLPSAFAAGADCGDTPVSCPVLPDGTAQIPGQDDPRCCAVVGGPNGFEYTEVVLAGTTFEVDGAMTYDTVANGPVNLADFVAANLCEEPPDEPVCDDGLVEARPGVCCLAGQEVLGGQCTDPCPSGQIRSGAGTCYTPCPAGQTRNASGTCVTPCPTGQTRNASGTCVTPCADGGTRNAAGQCPCPAGQTRNAAGQCAASGNSCPAGQVDVGNNRCCPTGDELVGNQCVTPCADNEIRGDDGRCRIDCPEGQLTRLFECCPTGTRPTNDSRCSEPCASGRFDEVGTCCKANEQVNPQTQRCAVLCASGQIDNTGKCCSATEQLTNGKCVPRCASGVIAPTDGECCASGQVIDTGGYCNIPSANNNYNTQTGECCPQGTTPAGSICQVACPPGGVRYGNNQCCPNTQSGGFWNAKEQICEFSS